MLDNYAAAGIPLETFVADSQYMDSQQDFTLGGNFTQSELSVCLSAPRSPSAPSPVQIAIQGHSWLLLCFCVSAVWMCISLLQLVKHPSSGSEK